MLKQFCRTAADLRRSSLLVVVIVAFGAVERSNAAVTVWNGPSTGGDFNDDNNWTLNSPGDNTPPPNGLNDIGIFNSDSNVDGTITFSADVSNASTFIQNTDGTVSFDVGTHKWTMSGTFLIGQSLLPGFPNVRQISGQIQSQSVLLGTEEFGPGPSLEITGPGTLWHATYESGAFNIGMQSSNATMTVHNGAHITADGPALVGLIGSSNNELIIDGVGSEMALTGNLGVGHTPNPDTGTNAVNNRAEITNGAKGSASSVLMGITPGATDNTLLVSGAGSTLTLTGTNNNDGATTAIGRQGSTNLLQIDNGGIVNGTNRFVLGFEATSTGNQILINNGSLFGTQLVINPDGSTTVTSGTVDLIQYFNEAPDKMVYEGGGITAASPTSVFTFNSGTVRSVNANINNGSPFTVGDGGGTSATYLMRKDVAGHHGTHTFTNGIVLASNGVLAGDGDIIGNVSGAGGSKVQVGNSVGVINVTGNWNNTGIGIGLDLKNLAASIVPGEQFDQLNISGQFASGGSIMIDRTNLVSPSTTQQLKLVGWGSLSGLSSSTAVSFIGGSPLAYAFMSDGLYVTIAGGGLPGDYNHDGKVNAADYVVWRSTDGTTGGYNTWRTNFGRTSGNGRGLGAESSSSVPEPASFLLSMVVVVCGITLRRRHT